MPISQTLLPELLACIILPMLVSWVITAWVIRHAPHLGLVHQPNHRSSHNRITPHGGGIGIVVSATILAIGLLWQDHTALWNYLAVILLAIIVAGKGLADDIFDLPASVRFMFQIALCAGLLLSLHTPPANGLEAIDKLPLWLFLGFVLIAGVWWLNLFNFMDGIDGLAASQAIFMLIGAASIIAIQSPGLIDTQVWCWMLGLASAITGFLWFNWSPARIFMGDTGSLFLAFMIFFFALLTTSLKWLGYTSWLILGAVFISDATVTLIQRFMNGQKIMEAHRSHVYQRLARRWQSHQKVTVLSILINLLWLMPLAWLASVQPDTGWWLIAVAYTPLLLSTYALGAGKPDYA